MNIKLVLTVLTLGSLMAAIDTTIVILALPTITADLHTNLYSSIWVLLAYLLILAILSTQTGRIGDIMGRSKAYNLGFVVFTIASALCGASPNVEILILARILQAIGGALMASNSGAIIAEIFPPNQRGKAYGITSLGWNIGALIGIILGGILTTFLGWRYIFYINVPIGIIASIVGFREIKTLNKVNAKLDVTGAILLGISLTLISLGAIFIASSGVTLEHIVEIIAGVALIPAFVINELKIQSPIINVKVFKIKILSYSLMASFLQGIGALSLSFLLIMYLQGVRGLSPLDSSLLLTPGYVVASVLAPFMGRIADRGKPGLIAGIGLILTFISLMAYYFILTPTTSLSVILGISAITGAGSAMFWPSNSAAIMFSAPREYYGAVSGISRTLGNIGTTLSYVLSITVATLVIPRYVAFEIFLGLSSLDGDVSSEFVSGLHFAFLVSAAIVLIAAILSILGGNTAQKQNT